MSLEARIEASIEGLLGRIEEETDAEDVLHLSKAVCNLADALDLALGPPAPEPRDAPARSPAD